MKYLVVASALLAMLAGPAMGTLPFADDFESGTANWQKLPGAAEQLQWVGDDIWKNKVPVGGDGSARAHEYVGGGNGYVSYHDFGAESGYVRAEVWIFEDLVNPNGNPVCNAIQLVGAGASPGYGTDYLQLGVIPWGPAGSAGYSVRTKYNDDHALGYINTGKSRKAGFTNLAIEVDSPGSGGAARFYIDGDLVGTSARSFDLQYIYLGFNYSNYENFWYDGVNVTPEPASALFLLFGGVLCLRRRSR